MTMPKPYTVKATPTGLLLTQGVDWLLIPWQFAREFLADASTEHKKHLAGADVEPAPPQEAPAPSPDMHWPGVRPDGTPNV